MHVIWASPPCTEYSKAKSRGNRNIDYANQIVLKTLEIIHYLQPTYYILENPQTGLLKKQSFMDTIPFADVDYCKYDMPYRKGRDYGIMRFVVHLNHYAIKIVII